jgi:hypothetical protein
LHLKLARSLRVVIMVGASLFYTFIALIDITSTHLVIGSSRPLKGAIALI